MIYVTYAPENRYSDLKAFLDSYAVDFSIDGKTYLRAPVMFCDINRPPEFLTKDSQLFPTVNGSMRLALVQYEPFKEEDMDYQTRWPFFVEYPFEVMFSFRDQWWLFQFAPGNTYQERTLPE